MANTAPRFRPVVALVLIGSMIAVALGYFQALEAARAALRLDAYSPIKMLLVAAAAFQMLVLGGVAMSVRGRPRGEQLGTAFAPTAALALVWLGAVNFIPLTWPTHWVAPATFNTVYASGGRVDYMVGGRCVGRAAKQPWWLMLLEPDTHGGVDLRLVVMPAKSPSDGARDIAPDVVVQVEQSNWIPAYLVPGSWISRLHELVVVDVDSNGSGLAQASGESDGIVEVRWTCADWREVRSPTGEAAPPPRLTGVGAWW